MATPIKSLFPPIEKKPFLLNKQKKTGAVARGRVSTHRNLSGPGNSFLETEKHSRTYMKATAAEDQGGRWRNTTCPAKLSHTIIRKS
jgi:hypothetical protein